MAKNKYLDRTNLVILPKNLKRGTDRTLDPFYYLRQGEPGTLQYIDLYCRQYAGFLCPCKDNIRLYDLFKSI